MTTTPPFQFAAQTPSTPLHGAKYDIYQPYTTRKSSRNLGNRVTRTPSPPRSGPPSYATSSSKSKRSSTHHPNLTYSPPSSNQASPQHKRGRKATKVNADPQVPNLDTFGHFPGTSNDGASSDQGRTVVANMLPTPAKTPRKKPTKPGLKSTARVLFPSQPDDVADVMPPLRRNKRNKRHIGFTINENENSDTESKIEIFTDSKEKIPEIDESEDNPFYVKPGTQAPTMERSKKRRKISGMDNTNKEIQEVLKRNEGMVYVFRGKKIYRKFEDHDEEEDLSSDDLTVNGLGATGPLTHSPARPFTRSSIKPRLLFPPKKAQQLSEAEAEDADEEAITDIEAPVVTPVKALFAPASPPSTGHATRAATKKAALDSSPLASDPVETQPHIVEGNRKGPRTFDGWQRTKTTITNKGKGKKRQGVDLERDEGSFKKAKTDTT